MLIQLASFLAAVLSILSVSSIGSESIEFLNTKTDNNQIEISAQNAFLIDTVSGSILFNKNADKQHPIASITKLMSALTIIDSDLDWTKPIMFEAQDRRNGGIPYLIPGEEIMPIDAWRLMLIGSSNDATALLARVSYGSEEGFVKEMNNKARELGLVYASFTDPTGLDAGNISTAREVGAFARVALSIPSIRDVAQTRQFNFTPKGKAIRRVYSTNWLLGSFYYPGIKMFGGKTGHIAESGYNLVSIAGDRNKELVGVVLGAESNEARFNELTKLLKFGFD